MVAVMVAISMVMLLTVAAIVLDFSRIRLDRQMDKLAADNAAISGIQTSDLLGTDSIHSFRGACNALSFLKRNQDLLASLVGTWRTGTGAAVGPTPCSKTDPTSEYSTTVCAPNTPSTWAWFQGTANGIAVSIKSGYDVTDGAWPDEPLAAGSDQGAQGGCDNLAVMITQTRDPGLASIIGAGQLSTRIRSVARILPPGPPEDPVALLLLERHNCAVLDNNGTNTQILVSANGTAPGRIHSDSLGDGSTDCGTNSQIINGNSANGIIAAKTATTPSKPGTIEVYALSGAAGAHPDKAYDDPPFVQSQGQPGDKPVAGKLLTRAPVDKEYRVGVQNAIATANAAWSSTPAVGDKVVTNCTNASDGTVTAATAYTGTVYFNCSNPISYNGTVSFAASKVIVNTAINLNGTSELSFPNAKEIYVKGTSSPSIGVNVNSNKLRVNTTGIPTPDTCPSTAGRTPAKMVIGTGALSASNNSLLQLCNTAVILMGNGAGGSGCVPATNGTPPVDPTTPCDSGYLTASGGTIEWTAPDTTSGQASASDWRDKLEDLALWSEAAGNSSGIGGGASTHLAGVFMVPNANYFAIKGGGAQNVTNSQYIARRLKVTGTGTVTLAPNPYDSVPVSGTDPYALVR